MNVAIVGGTGFIGRTMAPVLTAKGHVVTIVTRDQGRGANAKGGVRVQEWDPAKWQGTANPFQGQDAVINLAGASIAERRWTPSRKAVLRASRVETTRTIVTALSHLSEPVRPKVLINASGTGFYGFETTDEVDESRSPGNGFLADLCVEWEREALRAMDYGIRTACLRISMVLGKNGGALQKMVFPFKLFLGGSIGTGTQPVSWIHVEDLGRLVAAICEQPAFKGAINAASPHPATMREFCRQLGRAMGRPSWLPIPAWALRLGLGELSTLMTHGQSVTPLVAQQLGFTFTYPDLESALSAIMEKDG
ncbi:MAG: TIGR01777 family protein [Nitrospira sp. SB0667_bin_9]|nr:TIGR01777 family protein [Nitrospira sp. SB0667_bin_9]MYD30715.1 TIGR01777 family protein [Nitrospira sp. SB0661_bin_20]MYJ23514.1 TIGR01777 family protein [Nitrospira sp. SB0673_bin_12]